MTPLDAALAYAARGWHVFPIWPIRDGRCSCGSGATCEHPGKHPIGALVPRGDHDATLDVGRIRFWWSEIPDANIAVALEPSGLTVLDVDVADGKPGKASLQQLETEVALPNTLCAQTGRGGLHGFYSTRGTPARQVGYRLGIDLLGKGYAVVAPSSNLGGQYRWLNALEPAPMPTFPASERTSKPAAPSTAERIPDGQRNATLASMAGRMRHYGHTEDEILPMLRAVNQARCDPPLAEDEVAKIAWSVARYNTTEQPVEVATFMAALQASRPVSPGLDLTALVPPPTTKQAELACDIARQPRPPVVALSTGVRELDALTNGGPATGQLSVLLGPPGAGKTAAHIALALALQRHRPVLLVETELEAHEACARMAAPLLGSRWIDVTDGRVTPDAVGEALTGLRVHVLGCDKLSRGMAALTDVAKEAIRIRDLSGGVSPIVAIDYLQDLSRGMTGDDARARVGDAASLLRVMAQELQTHVIAVSSVSRAFYSVSKISDKDDPTLWLAAGKESGDIDYAAALIIGIEVGDKIAGQDWRWARWALAKVRRGETGYVGMRFYGASGRWTEDPGALSHMALEKRGEARMEQIATGDDEKILLKIRTTPDLSKRQLREVCGIKMIRADAAISRLLASGAIVVRDAVSPDALGRPQKKQVLSVPAQKPTNGTSHKPMLSFLTTKSP